jgi:hypothetical protein
MSNPKPKKRAPRIELDARTRALFRAFGAEGGRKGGPKGGPARMAALTPDERRDLARKAAAARWAKKRVKP